MNNEKLQKLREEYSKSSLDESDVNKNPFRQFEQWMNEAITSQVPEPNAMTLATVDGSGKPHARVVLLKGLEDGGLVFYTNYASAKGRELAQNPHASLNFLWLELERQVRIEGKVQKLSREESEAYFKQRPHESQLGALVSNQTAEVPNREFLEQSFSKVKQQYANKPVPMPETWGGYKLTPELFEFWQGRHSRLHDRIKYEGSGSHWKIKRLAP